MRHVIRAAAVVAAFAAAFTAGITTARGQWQWDLPPRVAPPRMPPGATLTPSLVELGRRLFYDTRLSGNGTQSCASCHRQELAFTDGRAKGLGSTGMLHPRGPMTLVNVAYRDALTWANPNLRTLEEQVLVPLFGTAPRRPEGLGLPPGGGAIEPRRPEGPGVPPGDPPIEMGLNGHEARVYASLARDGVYGPLFAAAFPGEAAPVTTVNVAAALASFVRSIVSFRAPFDRYREYEESGALSQSAIRGSVLFFSSRRAGCSNCHRGLNLDGGSKTAASPAGEEPVFQFHNTGLYAIRGLFSYPADNTGLYAHTGLAEDVGKFRVPTLRNIVVTAPYMHDGSIGTLDEVLDHYAAGGRAANPNRSTGLRPFTLSPSERQDLIAFLESLTDREALRDPRWSDPWTPAARTSEGRVP